MNWMYCLLFCSIILFNHTSCSEREKQKVSMDELIKPSNYIESDETQTKSNNFKISEFSKHLIDTFSYSLDSVIQLKENEIEDRFTTIQKEKWKVRSGADFLMYKHWKYLDTNIAENVWFTQLDYFGKKKGGIEMGDRKNISANTMLLVLQHKSLLYLETSKKIDLKKHLQILDTLGFGSSWKYVLFQPRNGKTEWYVVPVKDSIFEWNKEFE
jgi:hypothetical protein